MIYREEPIAYGVALAPPAGISNAMETHACAVLILPPGDAGRGRVPLTRAEVERLRELCDEALA